MGERFYLGPYELGPGGENEGIYTGDSKELANLIPGESVDLIFCDPAYQNIDDYRWLAETAVRVLKDGGNCITQYAHYYQLEVLNAMDTYLDFVWPLTEFLWGTNATFWKHRIIVKSKPYAWFSKGKRGGGYVFDVIKGGGMAKASHEWGDSPNIFLSLIDRLTNDDAIIFDPFTGGGTVPAVCKMLGRKYLAFEIEPDTAELARERVRKTQAPLPGLAQETQAALKLMEDDNG